MVDKKVAVAGAVVGFGLVGTAIYLAVKGRSTPPPEGTVTLHGTVWDAGTGQPLPGARVALNGYSATTDGSGNYLINNIAPDTYILTFHHDGYEDLVEEVVLAAGDRARHAYLNQIAAVNTISLGLGNVPSDVDIWQLGLSDTSHAVQRFTDYIPILQPVAWSGLPSSFQFPGLLILAGYQWIEVGESVRQTYGRQSYWGPDQSGYDPNFVLYNFGDFMFDFNTGQVVQVG
jgi:hypothetical protein